MSASERQSPRNCTRARGTQPSRSRALYSADSYHLAKVSLTKRVLLGDTPIERLDLIFTVEGARANGRLFAGGERSSWGLVAKAKLLF
jgi:hypothetical protein